MTSYAYTFFILSRTVITVIVLLTTADTSVAQSEEIFALRLSTQPFSTLMCKKIRSDENIRIRIANHRDLILQKVPNQFIPKKFEEARKKSYVHFVTFQDLTNSVIPEGAIAFDMRHAVIFTENHHHGISRAEFVAQLPSDQRSIAHRALNTFLRLHPILKAAIDGCRPYPSQARYGTDNEIDKIEFGRMTYRDLAKQYNAHPSPTEELFRHETGKSGGFFDPTTLGKRVSYHSMNPLNFYRP